MRRRDSLPLHDYPARRIALIKPSSLGDVVHSLPVLTAIRARYPKATVAWVINRDLEPLIMGHPDLDYTLPFDREACRGGLLQAATTYRRFFRKLRRQNFDLVVDLQGLLRSGLMTAACRARRRVGLSSAREGAGWFYTDVVSVPQPSALHAVDRYWLIAKALGVGDACKNFHLPIAESDRRWAAQLLCDCPRPWLALAVGARWETKRWPIDHFAALAHGAQSMFGGTVLFIGGPGESRLAQGVAMRLWGEVRDLTGQTTLGQLTALLSCADVLLANDSGPLHLAAALGRPVVAPYTCTKIRLHGPYGAEEGAVEARIWCQGSYLKRCQRLDCMSALTSNHLWPNLHAILRRVKHERRPSLHATDAIGVQPHGLKKD